jgi:hypothetical protein
MNVPDVPLDVIDVLDYVKESKLPREGGFAHNKSAGRPSSGFGWQQKAGFNLESVTDIYLKSEVHTELIEYILSADVVFVWVLSAFAIGESAKIDVCSKICSFKQTELHTIASV